MTTIVDALTDATTALNNATTEILSLQQTLSQEASASQQAATTVINNFLGRPAVLAVFCDPVNGNDANDGTTIATAKKSIDTIIGGIGISATEILLLGDATISQRQNVYGPLSINGIQPSAAAPGYIPFLRTVSFLGTAVNSPSPLIGTFCSGMFNYASLTTNYINFALPSQPAGQNVTAHFYASGVSLTFGYGTITVADQTAGSLLGSQNRSNVYMQSMTYGTGAAGHVFQGVAAGANPNSQFQYLSNVTSG